MELYDVFISYRRSDGTQLAEELYAYLTDRGLSVFLDEKKKDEGEMFPPWLERALQTAPNYVLIATKDVFPFREKKDWVRREIAIALEKHGRDPASGTLTVLAPEDVVVPDDDCLPEDVAQIANVGRVMLEADRRKAFAKVFGVATKVKRGNLWAGARNWLQESRAPGGRFAGLDICESILPNAQRKNHAHMPVYVRGEDGGSRDLFSAIGESRGHVYLIGQGGIGKTTALMHIMDKAYSGGISSTAQVPIFVELSFAPDTYGKLYSTEVASFIRRSVYRQIRRDLRVKQVSASAVDELDEIFTIAPDVAVRPVNELFSERTDAPEYLLLLDGLNEVSQVVLENDRSVQEMVVGEIDYLMRFCPNVRVVLTSRTDEVGIGGKGVTRLYLSGVDSGMARSYLLERGVEEKRIEAALQNRDLAQTLTIPLFLTMYASLSQGADALTQGEILRLFFHERGQNLEVYTAQDRLIQTRENLHNAASQQQRKRPEAKELQFILDFVLPELAWYMERNGQFYLSEKEVDQVLWPLLKGVDETDFCGPYGQVAFTCYRKAGSARDHIQRVSEKLCKVMDDSDEDEKQKGEKAEKNRRRVIRNNILTCCMGMLGILRQDQNQWKYGFVHQHIRDYFAAVRNINTMTLALCAWEQEGGETARECLEPVLHSATLGMTVRRFMGEYLGEHRNRPLMKDGRAVYGVPKVSCDRNMLERVLDIYRGRFDGEDGYALYNLLKILTEVRGALAGCDLSGLDLTGCQLNGTRLGIPGLSAKVQGCRFDSRELFYYGHTKPITALDFSPDGAWLLSASEDGKVCIWDAKTGIQHRSIAVEGKLRYAGFDASGTRILTASWGRTGRIIGYNWRDDYAWMLRLWDIETGQKIRREMLQASEVEFSCSVNKKLLLAWTASHFWVLDTERLKLVAADTADGDCQLRAACFAGNDSLALYFCSLLDSTKNRTELRCLDGSSAPIVLPDLKNRQVKCLAGLDGELCAVIKEGDDVEVRLMDSADGKCRIIRHEKMGVFSKILEHYFLHYSDQEKWLAVCLRGVIHLYERENFKPVQTGIGEYIAKCAFHDGGKRVALGSGTGDIRVIDTVGFLPAFSVNGAFAEIVEFALSPDGRYLAVDCKGGKVGLWDIQNRCCIAHRDVDGQGFFFSSDSRRLAIISSFHTQVLTIPDMQVVHECGGIGTFVACDRYFEDVQGDVTNIRDASTFETICSISDGHICGFVGDRALVKYQSGELIGAQSQDDNLAVLDIRSGELCGFLSWETGGEDIRKRVSTGGDLVALMNPKGHLAVYSVSAMEKLAEIWDDKFEGTDLSLELSADGKYLTINTGNLDSVGNTVILDTETLQKVVDRQLYDGFMQCKYSDLVVECMGGRRKHGQFSLFRTTGEMLWTKTMDFRIPWQYYAMDRVGKVLVLRESADRLGIYKVSDAGVERQWTLEIEPGLELSGVDMRRLHPNVVFSPEQKRKLRQYGAILPEE